RGARADPHGAGDEARGDRRPRGLSGRADEKAPVRRPVEPAGRVDLNFPLRGTARRAQAPRLASAMAAARSWGRIESVARPLTRKVGVPCRRRVAAAIW